MRERRKWRCLKADDLSRVSYEHTLLLMYSWYVMSSAVQCIFYAGSYLWWSELLNLDLKNYRDGRLGYLQKFQMWQ